MEVNARVLFAITVSNRGRCLGCRHLEAVETLLVIFPEVVSACRAVGRIIRSGLVPAALEIIDQRTIRAVEDSVYAAGLPRDAGAVLIAELDGPALSLAP